MADIKEGLLREAWTDSLQPTIAALTDRFLRCSLKGIPFSCMPPVSEASVDAVVDTMHTIDPSLELGKLQKQQTKYQHYLEGAMP